MKPTIGSVPYLNAKPLISWFVRQRDASPVALRFAVPSQLPEMLDSDGAQAVMTSSFDALRSPGRRIAAHVAIASLGAAESVRLFSKVAPEAIQTLALDSSSLTSVNLARVILAERYSARPMVQRLDPDRDAMLTRCDAAVLIGDKGLAAEADDLCVLDLGAEWTSLTGLPFVWALWMGGDRLDARLAGWLVQAKEWGLAHMDEVVAAAGPESGFDAATCKRYLTQTMNYDLSDRHLAGLRRFGELLAANGLLGQAHDPTLVEPAR